MCVFLTCLCVCVLSSCTNAHCMLASCAVAIYTNLSDMEVGCVPEGGSESFDGVLAVAVVSAKAIGFALNTKLQTRMFQQVGERLGASLSWDGGGGERVALASLRDSKENVRVGTVIDAEPVKLTPLGLTMAKQTTATFVISSPQKSLIQERVDAAMRV